MNLFWRVRIFVLLFAVLALALGFTALNHTGTAGAGDCCWVLICTMEPPIVCWEECLPCTSHPVVNDLRFGKAFGEMMFADLP
jgi:hypothetical protein